jgi:non-specific serine/threonine protein kinase
LVLSQELGNKWYTTAALEGLAGVAAAQGESERAARLFGAVETLVDASGIALHPSDHAMNQRALDAVRANLDDSTFTTMWESGRSMTMDAVINDALTHAASAALKVAPSNPVAAAGLTTREEEVLRLLAEGLADREIGEALFISRRTVNGHVTNLLAKLGLESRTAAAAFAIRNGLG